jgi:hypothetical protein
MTRLWSAALDQDVQLGEVTGNVRRLVVDAWGRTLALVPAVDHTHWGAVVLHAYLPHDICENTGEVCAVARPFETEEQFVARLHAGRL